jgi:2-keto-4-pentenoate hydratase
MLDGNRHFMRLIEPEFGFRLKNDLPPSDAPFEFADVVGAVDALVPLIEIVDTAYRDWTSVGVLSLIADNMLSGGLDLAAHEVALAVNGETVTRGRGGNVLDHPVNALLWLANDLPSMGTGLRAGEIIATGLSTGLAYADVGDTAVADFGDFGQVTVGFSDA